MLSSAPPHPGKNLVITHEPTFYSHLNQTGDLEQRHDTVLANKQAFIRDHHMVIWRFTIIGTGEIRTVSRPNGTMSKPCSSAKCQSGKPSSMLLTLLLSTPVRLCFC
jgi:hypothetical protein